MTAAWPRAAARSMAARSAGSGSHGEPAQQRRTADPELPAADDCLHTLSGNRLEALACGMREAALLRALDDAAGDRVFRVALHRRSQGERVVLAPAARGCVISTTRNSPRVSVPVLSKTTAFDVARLLESTPVAHQESVAGAERGGDRDHERDGETQRVGTGDDQDRDQRARSRTTPRRRATNQPTSVSAAATTAMIVSARAARSARACARERELCACSTRRMMPASAVCSPVPVTSTRREPEPFTVPAIAVPPGPSRPVVTRR
mgnify:CR=1 FL=1